MTGVERVPIRPARIGEHAAVVACVRAAYAKYVERLGREPAPMLADYATLIARGVVYVIPADGGLHGILVLEPVDGAMLVENVAVLPEHQGYGFGRAMLDFAERRAREERLGELRLYTNELMTENLSYYRKLGFEEVERRAEHGFRRVFMRKRLGREG
jgi:GNAT superfamily N-acetyltransferase